ncbi:MAG: efflux RND transporter periplasmic adaptor subunit [Devosia sp.]
MIRQVLLSIVIVGAAVVAYVFFVPGAPETLARYGIELPFLQPANAAPAGPGGGQQAQAGGQRTGGGGGPGGFGGRGGARTMVVVTSPVVMATINDRLTAIGEGAATQSVTVVSNANGTLRQLSVAPGQSVAANDVIGTLDADAEEIAAERARLAFTDAETALNRTNGLAAANNATSVQVAAAQLAYDNARLELQNAELALARRTIVTPIAGTVGLFQVSAGNTVSAQTVVTTIEDTSSIRVSFWVPERYAPVVAVGMPLEASAVALPGTVIDGTVSALDNRIDTASRTLKVEAEIPNDDGRLRPGMSFSVSLGFPGEEFPAVDPLSIQWSNDGAYLWKYVDGTVERVPVRIIQRNSDGVLVEAALVAGDQIVTQGVQQLTAGASVRLLDEAPADERPAAGAGDPS